jgi:hypothetical protein
MSSKKARHKERQHQEQEESRRRGRLSPATLFILTIGIALLATVVVALGFTDRSGRGAPPYPGAVWSEPHGHWH